MISRLRLVALAICAILALASPGSGQVLLYSLFERYLDSLRVQTGIPGLSAAIVKNVRRCMCRGPFLDPTRWALPARRTLCLNLRRQIKSMPAN